MAALGVGPRRARGGRGAAPFEGDSWWRSGGVGVRGGAGAAWAALFRRKGSVACLHVPLELVSGPGTRGWAAFCWLDRNFGFPAHFPRPPQSSPILLAEKASRKSITHSLTVHPRAPKKRAQLSYSLFIGFLTPPPPPRSAGAAGAVAEREQCGLKACSAKIRFARLREAPAPFGAAAGGAALVARPALPAICRKRDLPRTSNGCSG